MPSNQVTQPTSYLEQLNQEASQNGDEPMTDNQLVNHIKEIQDFFETQNGNEIPDIPEEIQNIIDVYVLLIIKRF